MPERYFDLEYKRRPLCECFLSFQELLLLIIMCTINKNLLVLHLTLQELSRSVCNNLLSHFVIPVTLFNKLLSYLVWQFMKLSHETFYVCHTFFQKDPKKSKLSHSVTLSNKSYYCKECR